MDLLVKVAQSSEVRLIDVIDLDTLKVLTEQGISETKIQIPGILPDDEEYFTYIPKDISHLVL
jgi:hypothetical protein